MSIHIVHERTLLGAVHSYLATLVRVRPQFAKAYSAQLEAFTGMWLTQGRANWLEAVHSDWLATYLASAGDDMAEQALSDFYEWALREELISVSPVPTEVGSFA